MAAVNLVILSSSPSKPHYHAPLAMSSSQDDLPSLATLWQNRPKLKMPTTSAKRMSTTPPNTWPDVEESKKDDIWDEPDDDPPAKVMEAKPAARQRGRPRKEVAATALDGTAGAEPPKKRGRPKKVAAEGDEAAAPKEKAIRKLRAKKVDEDGQTKIAKGLVTKTSSSTTSKGKTTETVSSHFAAAQTELIDIEDLSEQQGPVPQDLELKKVGERRMSWTPAKENGNYSYQMEELTAEANQDGATLKPQGFGSLLDNYGYHKIERSALTTSMDENNPLRKRKRIELVKTGSAVTSKATGTAKSKAVKKKARTITDKATAEYAAAEEDEVEPAPILQYFRREDSLVDPSGAPRTKARKILTKPGKGKNATEPVSTLLAPQAALEHAKRQEFVFGTSSQLARDDDPAFLRDLQTAMQLSNLYDMEDPFDEPLPSLSSTNGSGKANLWEAAALIEEEGAKDMEVMDLSRSSQVETRFNKEATPAPAAEAEASGQSVLSAVPENDWIEIDQTPGPVPVHQHAPAPPRRDSSPLPIVQASAPRIAAKLPAEKSTEKLDLSTSDSDVPMMASRSRPTAKSIAPRKPTAQCADYDSFSTTDLAKEIAKYKFKPIKKREDMVTMLKQCWEAKQKKSSGVLQHNPRPVDVPTPASQPPALTTENVASPPGKRGRPRKGEPTTASMRKLDPRPLTTTRTKAPSASAPALPTPKKRGRPRKVLPIPEDISDAEGPTTPSPLSVRSTQPPPLEIIQESDHDAKRTILPLSPSSQERELFSTISRAVTSQPPSRDIKRLSWYEKILLYDPVLLEDLTKWLNEEGLGSVGYDGEVQPLQVRAWCLRKGICCLWKESKRNRGVGGVKKIGRE